MSTTPIDEQYDSPLLCTHCHYPENSWQMERKAETASTVLSQYNPLVTRYTYDAKGHLTESSMYSCHEDYAYNGIGQRISMLHTRKGVFQYTYDQQGKLTQKNDTRFVYDQLGRLAGLTAPNTPAKRFTYERVKIGTLDIDQLSTFQDSTGKIFTYKYTPENPLPVAVYYAGQPIVRYQWDERGSLPRLLSSTTSLATWKFCYSEEHNNGLPDSVILSGPVVAKLGYLDLKSLQCKLGYDHLGTVKLIADQYNDLVKELIYDSFGNVISETEQRIYFPLGFAGGLRDIATGFVCFGFRDYDPSVGRFTTPDPALDMRGDGDIYDYCVDDPVNLVDVEGLRFKTKIPKPNRYPGDARSNNQHQKDKKQREKEANEERQNRNREANEQLRKNAADHELVDTGAQSDDKDQNKQEEPGDDFKELFDAFNLGYSAGSKKGGRLGGVIGAAGAVLGTKAAKKVFDKAKEIDINIGDSTSISALKTGNTGKCTPGDQPRTRDGRFTACGHTATKSFTA